MAKREKISDFHKIVKNQKLPILTLDSRWHGLFTEDQKSDLMKELEQKINNLLKKQGKLVNDIKDMKKLKSSLLSDIMAVSSDTDGKEKEKKLEKNKQYINELNEKIEKAMDELADIPYRIKEENEELMAESIHMFYDRLEKNKAELKEVAEWINQIRDELKQKILLKQDLELKNSMIYTYMHDILSVDLMEMFDKEQDIKKS